MEPTQQASPYDYYQQLPSIPPPPPPSPKRDKTTILLLIVCLLSLIIIVGSILFGVMRSNNMDMVYPTVTTAPTIQIPTPTPDTPTPDINATVTHSYGNGYTNGYSQEQTDMRNWIQTHCTTGSSGIYYVWYDNNGQLHCY